MNLKRNLKKWFEKIIDNTDAKIVDNISYVVFTILSLVTIYMFISTFSILRNPILKIHPKWIYSIVYILGILLFFFTMLGKITNKPNNRPKIFLLITLILMFSTYSLLVEIFNSTFTDFLDTLISIADVPSYLMITNIRIISIFIPIIIVCFSFLKGLSVVFKREYKKELLEYSLEILTRNVDKLTDYTVDIKMCEDIETGEDVVQAEKQAYRHKIIAGSSGSGKTATVIRPELAQIFFKKAFFRECLKGLSFQAIEKGICYLKAPVTNKFINENFDMDLIGICNGKENEFKSLFKDLIIGVRNNDVMVYDRELDSTSSIIPISFNNNVKAIKIKVTSYYNGMVFKAHEYEYKKEGYCEPFMEEDYSVTLNVASLEEVLEKLKNDGNEEDNEKFSEGINIETKGLTDKFPMYTFHAEIFQKGDGKIIYKGVGCSVVAPDGGLPSEVTEIAAKNGVKVHRIDPKADEIRKGGIAHFNPLLVGEPEKAGDIISSILVSMDSGGKDANPYFKNASIRAIRNLVILLKVTYSEINKGLQPTLEDVLDLLNNFNAVVPYVEYLEKDDYLSIRWKSVIDYFRACFFPQPINEGNGKPIEGGDGRMRKKTEEAISGIINQMDNFLGREEIKYILCDRENSINLSEVLEKGECIAVSTRQSELGEVLGKAFALFLILSIQNAVLCRYSEDENPEVPHFLYIDEFPFYVNDGTKVFFTFARKYKCAVTVAVQNLAQLAEETVIFKEIVLTNCNTKIILPGANVEDIAYYTEMFGFNEVFETQTSVSSNPIMSENANYSEGARGSIQEKANVSKKELAELKFQRCFYLYTNPKGITKQGKGYVDFMKLTSENTLKNEYFDFEKFKDIRKVKVSELDNIDRPSLKKSSSTEGISVLNSKSTTKVNTDIPTEDDFNEILIGLGEGLSNGDFDEGEIIVNESTSSDTVSTTDFNKEKESNVVEMDTLNNETVTNEEKSTNNIVDQSINNAIIDNVNVNVNTGGNIGVEEGIALKDNSDSNNSDKLTSNKEVIDVDNNEILDIDNTEVLNIDNIVIKDNIQEEVKETKEDDSENEFNSEFDGLDINNIEIIGMEK